MADDPAGTFNETRSLSHPTGRTTVSLTGTHWETLLTAARLHAYGEVRQMPNVTTKQCQQIVAAAVDGVRQQIEKWAAQQAANNATEK